MILVVFDNGGTLIADPFTATLERLRANTAALRDLHNQLDVDLLDCIISCWVEENASFDFPFASHFLQEEVWILRALDRVMKQDGRITADCVPILAPQLLYTYRRLAQEIVERQPQIPKIKSCLRSLPQREKLILAVASNDREFATHAMLKWAGLYESFDLIVTSEGLSTNNSVIQKPSDEFFVALESRVQTLTGNRISAKIHIGDNETNDIEAPSRLGYTTVRYINKFNPAEMKWLDHRSKTAAPYKYTDPAELYELLPRMIEELSNVQ